MTRLLRATTAARRQARRNADTLAEAYGLTREARDLLADFLLLKGAPNGAPVTDEIAAPRLELERAGLADLRLVPLAPDLFAFVCDVDVDRLRKLARAARAVAAASKPASATARTVAFTFHLSDTAELAVSVLLRGRPWPWPPDCEACRAVVAELFDAELVSMEPADDFGEWLALAREEVTVVAARLDAALAELAKRRAAGTWPPQKGGGQ